MGLEGESRMEPEDRVTGPGQSEGIQHGRTGWEKRCDRCRGRKKTDLGRRQDRLGKDTRWMFRPDLEKGWDRPGEEKRQEQGGGASLGEEAVRNTGQMGEMVLRKELERMRRSRERVWSSSLELEALEQEVMRHSPDRGPRDLEVTAAAAELTTSAPAACVKACLCGWVCKCVHVCLSVCLCMCESGPVCMGGCVGVCLCAYMEEGLSVGMSLSMRGP